jgi:hypothetical protein
MRSVASGLAALLISAPAAIAEDSVVGVWDLQTFSQKLIKTGEIKKLYGEHPSGRVIFTKGGNCSSIG